MADEETDRTKVTGNADEKGASSAILKPAPGGPGFGPRVDSGLPPLGAGAGQTFLTGIPFSFGIAEDNMTAAGDATISDALRSVGSSLPRPSVLATIADCVAGIPAGLMIVPTLSVTLDIVVRIVAPGGDRLEMKGELVKVGRSTVAGEVFFYDAQTMATVAYSYLTFMGSPRPQDHAPPFTRGMRTVGSMEEPFPEHVGAHILEPGVVEIERTPFVVQAAGSLQGGIVALIGEMAAESLLGSPVIDLDVRYLSAVRVGPGLATATALGDGVVRVEVRDQGRDGRLTSLITARVAPTAAHPDSSPS
jgi:acyl-coenzyme A thioesterase PaaI-like protein